MNMAFNTFDETEGILLLVWQIGQSVKKVCEYGFAIRFLQDLNRRICYFAEGMDKLY